MYSFRPLLLVLTTLIICTSCAPFGFHHKQQTTLCILHTNDHHGHPLSFPWPPAKNAGGLPARASMIAEIRQDYDHVLVLDAGDINTGRPESDLFAAEPDILGYNYIGYQAMAVGNHEFDHPDRIRKEQEELSIFPWISANIVTSDGKPVFTPYIIKDMGGVNVAILGLTTKETAQVGNPKFIGDLTFLDEVETARRYMPMLQNQADIVIGLVHMGLYDNMEQGSARLAQHVHGFDLIIDGHTHTLMEEPMYVNGTPIVTAHKWGLVVGLGLMQINGDSVSSFVWDAIPINPAQDIQVNNHTQHIRFIKAYPQDANLLAKLAPYAQKVEDPLGTVIGKTETAISSQMVRRHETALGNLIADSMLWYTQNTKVDFALQNGGGIRAGLPKGPITMRAAYEILPFDNSVVLVTMDGRDVLKLFDIMAQIPPGDGAFPQVSAGVRLLLNQDNGQCEEAWINGQPVDPQAVYTIATNSYLAAGGDGYSIFQKAKVIYDTSKFQRDIFIEYIKYLYKVTPPKTGHRIEIIRSSSHCIPMIEPTSMFWCYDRHPEHPPSQLRRLRFLAAGFSSTYGGEA